MPAVIAYSGLCGQCGSAYIRDLQRGTQSTSIHHVSGRGRRRRDSRYEFRSSVAFSAASLHWNESNWFEMGWEQVVLVAVWG